MRTESTDPYNQSIYARALGIYNAWVSLSDTLTAANAFRVDSL